MTLITIVLPAKNAARYIKRTISSISEQTISSLVVVQVLFATSTDNTEDILASELRKAGLSFEFVYDNRPLNEALLDSFMSVKTKYSVFMCLSDQYISPAYLERAVSLLESNDYSRSFCHANVLTGIPRDGGYTYQPGMYSRSLYQPLGGAGFYANFAHCDDGLNELALVYRSSTLKLILQGHCYRSCLKSNILGSIIMATFACGLIGYYLPIYSTIGYHHHDSRNFDKKIQMNDSAWTPLYEAVRGQVRNKIHASSFIWSDPELSPYPKDLQSRFYGEYFAQLSIIRSTSMVLSHA